MLLLLVEVVVVGVLVVECLDPAGAPCVVLEAAGISGPEQKK